LTISQGCLKISFEASRGSLKSEVFWIFGV